MNESFSDWNIEDHLTTPEERAAYIVAASEEGSPDSLPNAFADVFRSMGKEAEANACENLAIYIRATSKRTKTQTRARKREFATT